MRVPLPILQPTKGVHVVVDRARLDHRDAVAFTSPIDGRVMFVLPWGELSYIGTTDTDTSDPPDDLTISADDMVYLLRSVNARFPSARLGLEDVRCMGRPSASAAGPERTRGVDSIAGAHHRAWLRRNDHVAGGKLTT